MGPGPGLENARANGARLEMPLGRWQHIIYQ